MTSLLKNTLLVLLFVSSASAQTFPDKPPDTDFFVDQANLLSEEDSKKINDLAGFLLQEERIPLLVVTIESLADQDAITFSIEEYAQALFDHWGIGFKDRNYGILLLVSLGDRKARIELGAGWGRDYDRDAQQIMDKLIIPAFKREAYSTGVADGVRGLDAMARGLGLPRATPPWWFLPLVVGFFVLIIAVIISLFRSGRSGWGWALIIALGALLYFILSNAANNRGSGGSFGGGFSGGGGATGSW